MKYERIIYGLGTLLVVAGAVFKIMHVPYANALLWVGFISTSLYQSWLIARLKTRVSELERNSPMEKNA